MNEKLNFSAVIWDLDGTLTDTIRDLAEAANAALRIHGLPTHTTDEYRKMVGNGVRALLKMAVGEGATNETKYAIMADYARLYDEGCLNFTRPYPGVVDVITELREHGVVQLIVTNKPQVQAEKIVAALFPKDCFSVIVGQRDDIPTKPDPFGTLSALHSVGITPDRALFVGDSDVDMITACNAGTKGAGVCWGFRGRDELASAGADYLVENAAELLEIVRG